MGMVTSAVPIALPPWRSVTNDRVAWQTIAIAITVITSGEHLVLGMDTGPRERGALLIEHHTRPARAGRSRGAASSPSA